MNIEMEIISKKHSRTKRICNPEDKACLQLSTEELPSKN